MIKLVSSEIKYDGRIIKVYRDTLNDNGKEYYREVVRHNGGAGVLVEKNGKFAFVRQYRHPMGRDYLEIPAGMRDKNEQPEVTAVRELAEECGLVAKNIRFVCEFAVSPGYTDETLFVYFVNDFENTTQSFDDDENLFVEWIEKNRAFEMLKNGEIKDGKTVIALYWYLANVQ